jgi:hypothetical protein
MKSRFSKYKYNIAVPTDYIVENELVCFIIPIAKENTDICFHLIPRENLQEGTAEKISDISNIVVITDMSFQEAVRYCDVNTSSDSTCCLEALNLGKPNILYNIDNKAFKMFNDKVDSNFTYFTSDPSEYIGLLTKVLNFDQDTIIKSQDNVFLSNYRQNVVSAVNDVLQN